MKRILLALLTSVIGIFLSFYFLRPSEWAAKTSLSKNVIAQVISIQNDVSRQEEGKLIWGPLRKGDIVHLGDKIKTSSLSSVFLLLKESSSRLEIEENSTVLMSGMGKKLTLNMLEGRVFLKQEEQGATEAKVDLVSGGKVVEAKGDVAVTIAKDGTSQVDEFKKVSENIFEELGPEYGSTIQTAGSVNLKWKPLKTNDEIWLETGESPLILKRSSTPINGSSGSAQTSLVSGLSYWRLVSVKDGVETKSAIMKLNVERPLAPVLIAPAENDVLRPSDKGFDLKWSRGNISDQYTIEISKTSDFSVLSLSDQIKNQTFYTVKDELSEGDYFWRIKDQSKVSRFTIVKGEKILSPVPVTPADGAIVYLDQSSRLDFEWREQPNAHSYEFSLMGTGTPKTNVLIQNKVSVNLNRLGKYSWSVTSQTSDGKVSVLPVKRSFEVREMEKPQWLNLEKKFFYLDSYPIIILKWSKNASGGAILKISDQPSMQGAQLFQINGSDFPYRPARDGFHYAQITLRDEAGQFSGQTGIFEFSVEKAPLPPVPDFLISSPSIHASTRGEFSVNLKNREPIYRTNAKVFNKRGLAVDERNFSDDKITFHSLLPGQYFLEAHFVDDYKRVGPASSRIEILVPEKSMIAAPKIKGIKVR